VTASVGLIKAQGGGWENPRQEVQQGLESESKKKMTLQTYQLAYARGDRQLFRDLNFEMHAGDALWLKGANGSGKTSLLRLVCGLALPLSGEVRWHGRDIRRLREDFHRNLFYCGHAGGVKDDLTALENVAIGSRLSGNKCSKKDAHLALDQMGLAHAAHLPARVLSQGQRKRVALARLCIDPLPTLLILDEPFTALDKDSTDHLCAMLNRHLAQGGMTLYTTHQELTLQAPRLQVLDLSEMPCSAH